MKTIGIDTNDYQIYVGARCWGQVLRPSPTLLVANIFESGSELPVDEINDDLCGVPYIFLDDAYDPVSRVRKGRIFKHHGGTQPSQWHVYPHSAINERINEQGMVNKSLVTFSQFSMGSELRNRDIQNPLVVLGNRHQFTVWSLIDVESGVSGETVAYLKARKTFGSLPKVDYSKIIESCRKRVREKLHTLADDIHTAGPESVIDRCREALTAILSAYAQQHGLTEPGKDLSKLADYIANQRTNPKRVAANLAKTVAILHSRGKNSEQELRDVRAINEQDAELAVQAVCVALNDLDLTLPLFDGVRIT